MHVTGFNGSFPFGSEKWNFSHVLDSLGVSALNIDAKALDTPALDRSWVSPVASCGWVSAVIWQILQLAKYCSFSLTMPFQFVFISKN